MKILITGGCGFLGSNIAADGLHQCDQVFIIDGLMRAGSNDNKTWLETQASSHQLIVQVFDVADADAVDQFFQQYAPFDAVAHLAGQVAMTTSMKDPRRDFLTNVMGTFNILEATRKYSPDAVFVYSSTNKVYGELNNLRYEDTPTRYVTPDYPNGFAEDLLLDFSSPYGCSKGAADQYVRDWHRNFGLKTIVFRHSSIYGGRQFSTFDQGWIGWFCLQALKQKQTLDNGQTIEPFTIAGNGKQVRDGNHSLPPPPKCLEPLIFGSEVGGDMNGYVDLIALYRSAFDRGRALAGSIFNIGGGIANSLSLLELFSYLENLLGIELRYDQLDPRHCDQKVFVADISAVKQRLDWLPQIACQDGINRQVQWVSDFIKLP